MKSTVSSFLAAVLFAPMMVACGPPAECAASLEAGSKLVSAAFERRHDEVPELADALAAAAGDNKDMGRLAERAKELVEDLEEFKRLRVKYAGQGAALQGVQRKWEASQEGFEGSLELAAEICH